MSNATPRKGRGDAGLGLRIRKLRSRLGLSQEALGHRVGRSEGWVFQVEKGEAEPGYFDLINIAAVLRVDVVRLLKDVDENDALPHSNAGASAMQSRLSKGPGSRHEGA